MKIHHLLPAVFTLLTLTASHAIDWGNTQISLTGSAEVVAISDVAVDAAGRTHTVFVQNFLDNVIVYRMRESGSAGFSDAETVKVPSADAEALHVSIDVTEDFTVQVAVLDELGNVRVYEKEERSTDWSDTFVGLLGSLEPEAGIDIRSRGNGIAGSALVYTKANGGTTGGGILFSAQQPDGGWNPPLDIAPGRNVDTGLAPTLIPTGILTRPLMVISYNSAEDRIEETSFTRSLLPPMSSGWRAPRQIAPSTIAARPDAEVRNGTIGVSFSPDGARVRYAEFQPPAPSVEETWLLSTVTSEDELEAGMVQSFGSSTALTLDAAGNPWIAYTRDQASGFNIRTRDIRARRLIPGIGWELSIVETPTSPTASNLQNTSALHLASGDNGDPSLIYEQDNGNTSTLFFARPETAPWVVGPPESLADRSVTSGASLTSGSDGTIYLAASTGFRRTDFGLPSVSNQLPVVVTYKDGEETREELPSTPENHPATAVVTTPDGALHALALRTPIR